MAPEKLRGLGAILLSARGRRFVNELGRRGEVAGVSGGHALLHHVGGRDNAAACAMAHWQPSCPCDRCADLCAAGQTIEAQCYAISAEQAPACAPALLQAILAQPSKQAVLLFGAGTAAAFGPALEPYLSSRLMRVADSPEHLEGQAGLPAEAVRAELAAYAQAAEAGQDGFGKRVFPAAIDPGQASCHAITALALRNAPRA